MTEPVGLNRTHIIGALWARMLKTSLALATSQSFSSISAVHDAMRRPSGLKSIHSKAFRRVFQAV